ncbi:sensor histidine kinase, partial [Rhodococcus tukisamuensis]
PAGLDPHVSAAAYGIVVEAVTNARRHSGAAGARVRAEAAGRQLTVVVRDAGTGFDPGRAGGVGTRSMRERASELGGTLVIDPVAPHGTRVTARLPLAVP